MITYQNELSNLSYTNKDFGSIFPELLELVQKISYKWDPSLSDESDPGVVLLKLAALLADKCNYNIDKNVLELFPLSVTQLSNARQLFDQCGYTMRHYSSATTKLKLRMIVEPDLNDTDVSELIPSSIAPIDATTVKSDSRYTRYYTLPRFTMFSDADNKSVYTAIEPAILDSNSNFVYVDAIQGPVSEYLVNGSNIVTLNALDGDNRLYLPSTTIAENGIFVSNVGAPDGSFWEATDNLLVHPIGSRVYKFGLSLDGKKCYIEFPTDIPSLMAAGLHIHYVTTSGAAGNIGKNHISKFFSDVKCKRHIANNTAEQSDIDITSDNINVANEDAAVNGRNPETIESAYRNYQKTKNTFNTLVSTQDYSNFFQSSNRYSNCFVCDRSDDVQSAYSVLHKIDGIEQHIPFVKKHDVEILAKNSLGEDITVNIQSDEMTAFDLRVYGLKYVDGIATPRAFADTFELEADATKPQRFSDAEELKCLSHNYLPFEKNRIILLKNKYPLVGKIISASKLTYSQMDDILNNVRLALFNLLNSQRVSFGEEIDYNIVYNTILRADSRISAIALNDITYQTHAIYIDETSTVRSLRIDADSTAPEDPDELALWSSFRSEIYAKSILNGNTPLFIPNNTFLYSLAHEALNDVVDYKAEKISSLTTIPLTLVDNVENKYYTTDTIQSNNTITLTSPNLVTEQTYSNYCQYVTNIGIGLNRTQPNPEGDMYDDVNVTRSGWNDDIEIAVPKNTDYVLKSDEYIVFFWRTSEDDTDNFTYVKYTGRNSETPCIIRPSFNLLRQPNPDNIGGTAYTIDDNLFMSLGDTATTHVEGQQLELTGQYPSVPTDSAPLIDINTFIQKYAIGGGKYSVKTESIKVQRPNRIHLNNTFNGSNKFFWILNNETVDKSTNRSVYRLFGTDDTEYTLQDGELLIYSNPSLTQLYTLGTGTRIERVSSLTNLQSWDCPALENKSEFWLIGPKYFEESSHRWFDISMQDGVNQMYATEMLYYKLAEGTKLRILLPKGATPNTDSFWYINNEGIHVESNSDDPDSQAKLAEELTALCSYSLVSTDGVEQELPLRQHPSIEWKISASCNINLSSESPQRLLENQGFTFEDKITGQIVNILGSNTERIFVQSDRTVSQNGGIDVDVSSVDMNDLKSVPLSLYVYKLRSSDRSTTQEIDNSNVVWNFSDEVVSASGNNVTLSNIKLTKGTYVLPITMQQITANVNVYWTRMRCITESKLNTAEVTKLKELGNELDDDLEASPQPWVAAGKPVSFYDVVSWIYGTANIDVSQSLPNVSENDLFNSIFMPAGGDFAQGYACVLDDESELSKMLVQYSTESCDPIKLLQDIIADKEYFADELQVGDILCVHTPSQVTTRPSWCTYVVLPTTVQVAGREEIVNKLFYIDSSTSGYRCASVSIDDLAERFSDHLATINSMEDPLKSELLNECYGFILRPSNLATSIVESDISKVRCTTVTDSMNVNKNITYYFPVTVSSSVSSYRLQIEQDESASTLVPRFSIGRMRNVSYPKLRQLSEDVIPEEFLANIKAKLKLLDTSEKFDFTHEVEDGNLIKCPLESTSFLDPAHVMNKFTICQYTIPASVLRDDLVVVSKAR